MYVFMRRDSEQVQRGYFIVGLGNGSFLIWSSRYLDTGRETFNVVTGLCPDQCNSHWSNSSGYLPIDCKSTEFYTFSVI